jgi:uncharacterized membrane protein
MGLKDKSSVVSVLLAVFVAAIAIAQVTYVILTGNTNIRIFLIASAVGSFVVLAVVAIDVIKNEKDIGETKKELSTPKAKDCPEYWTRTWSPCSKSYSCSSKYTLPDGTEMQMTPSEMNINLTDYNQSHTTNCGLVGGNEATYPFMEMVNRCRANART